MSAPPCPAQPPGGTMSRMKGKGSGQRKMANTQGCGKQKKGSLRSGGTGFAKGGKSSSKGKKR